MIVLLLKRDKKMRNRSGLRDYGLEPTRWDNERQQRVPRYDPVYRGRYSKDGVNYIGISRIKLDRQGYDRHGSYYGVGAPLWAVYDDNGDIEINVRAPSKKAVKDMIRAEIPNARFYR